METPYESYIEYGGPPPLGMSGVKTDILSTYNKGVYIIIYRVILELDKLLVKYW